MKKTFDTVLSKRDVKVNRIKMNHQRNQLFQTVSQSNNSWNQYKKFM